MERREYELIVIGGGISGVAMAHLACARGMRTLLLEKQPRLGGCLHSHAAAGGFWVEMGAHSCFNSYGRLIDVLKRCGLQHRLIARRKMSFKLYAGGALRSIPSCLSFTELLTHLPRLLTARKQGQTVRGYYEAIVGPKNYARVLGPAFNAVLSQPADRVPAELMFRKRSRRREFPSSFSLPGGLQALAEGIAAASGCDTSLGVTVGEIRRNTNGYVLSLADGRQLHCRFLCLATPAGAAASMLAGVHAALAGQLARVRHGMIESLAVTLRRGDVRLGDIGGVIGQDEPFYSAVSRDVIEHDAYRGFTFHFKPGLLDRERKLACIARVLGIDPARSIDIHETVNTLPCPGPGHLQWIGETTQLLDALPLLLCGNYFAGIAIEDCMSRAHEEFARLDRLAARP